MSVFEDARDAQDGSRIETDLAIIGGGVAGITLAHALANTGLQICLIEAGGMSYDPAGHALYEGENVGVDYPLRANRLRYLGGSSNHWGGYCLSLDDIDFEKRDWVPYSGWPITRQELAPYYVPATERVQLNPPNFDDPQYWAMHTAEPLIKTGSGRMRNRFVQFSPPTRFGERYIEDLKRAPNVRVLLNANVVNIATEASARHVTHLDIKTLTGRHLAVQARRFVLATGGLENPRMLLLSDGVVKQGLGNQNDLVGRFFMEHPHVSGFGEAVVADLKRMPPIYRERVKVEGVPAQAAFAPSFNFMREHGLLNAMFMLGLAGRYKEQALTDTGSEMAVNHQQMLRAARPFLRDGDPFGEDGVWLGIGGACEQLPNPDSRVSLSNERDALDLRKIKLDWRLCELSRRSLLTHIRSLAMELGALGIGRMTINIPDDGIWPEVVNGGAHHMGTTRMHDDPKQGVVDRNCRVHGVDNLYIAGSSVFTTSGAANPTLTLVALTLRLADHLRESRA